MHASDPVAPAAGLTTLPTEWTALDLESTVLAFDSGALDFGLATLTPDLTERSK